MGSASESSTGDQSCHDRLIVEEPDTLVTPMASCGFLHVDHLLQIELKFADVVYLFGDPKVM